MVNKISNQIQKKLNIDASYFLRGGIWLLSSQFIAITFGIATTALLAFYLTEIDYGIYRYLISLATFIATFSLFGIGQSILQASAKGHLLFYQESLRVNALFSLGISLIALGLSGYYFVNENILLSLGCLFVAFIQPFVSVFQFVPAFLQGQQKFHSSSILQIIKSVTVSGSTISALFISGEVLVIFGTFLVANAIVNLLSFLIFKIKQGVATPLEKFNEYYRYAKNTSIRSFVSSVAFRVDSILVFTQLGAIELAIYSIATIIPEQIKGTFKNLFTLLVPKYSTANMEVVRKGAVKRSFQLGLILIAITVAYLIASPHIYELLFPKYTDAIIYSQIFALVFPAYIYYIPLSIITSEIDEANLYRFHILTSIAQLIITPIFIITGGILGAILAKVITQYGRMFYCYFLLKTSNDLSKA